MDFDAFRKQLDAARELRIADVPMKRRLVPGDGNGTPDTYVTEDAAEFTLTLPTDFDMAAAHTDHRDAEGRPNQERALNAVLMQSVTAWKGVKACHVLPAAPDEALDFSAGALKALLDIRRDVTARLAAEMIAAREQRFRQREDAAKN
jgi:hypothetical protein